MIELPSIGHISQLESQLILKGYSAPFFRVLSLPGLSVLGAGTLKACLQACTQRYQSTHSAASDFRLAFDAVLGKKGEQYRVEFNLAYHPSAGFRLRHLCLYSANGGTAEYHIGDDQFLPHLLFLKAPVPKKKNSYRLSKSMKGYRSL
ncbi:hypothetical protein [Chitinophaga sp. S165]|uniref:hypothetical protein n=1 Tax=Chitinophaga sp. S165 TaxID=2135462 RepID=UPI000D70CF2E|nr:hypothetical protein [Chitinophaga sp. S165]PWV47132.1 hypothetical protein C7475_109220 [Chitinophaga sp. S165]